MPLKYLLLLLLMFLHGPAAFAAGPALVLQITVDQLRGDMPFLYAGRFGEGGFRYLLENGTIYRNVHYRHATTSTAVGHATLATGGNVRDHGMAGNDWWDSERHQQVYCVEDSNSPLLGGKPGDEGRSPRNLESSTFGDELVFSSNARSRVFSVSTKDRAAIIMGGHSGKAYWYSKQTGGYVSSRWYHDSPPAWLNDWNAAGRADSFDGWSWELLKDRAGYRFDEEGERGWVRPRGGMGESFPHRLVKSNPATFYSALRYTPATDRLTLEVVKALISVEAIGRGAATDYLSVSFSATDYIGHAFGPNSLEAEDNQLRLDRVLAELLRFVDQRVGLRNTLVVLSSDHGATPAPEYLQRHGLPAGRIGLDEHLGDVNRALMSRFKVDRPMISTYLKPSLYLDMRVLDRFGVDARAAERALLEEMLRLPGIGVGYTRGQLLDGRLPGGPLERLVDAAFHASRSGNVMLYPESSWYISDKPDGDAATHGTPYTPDTHVPLIFAGPGIPARTVYRRVAPRDVAPTLSAIMGIQPPSGSTGKVLVEVVAGAP